jgi:hypothetical protein
MTTGLAPPNTKLSFSYSEMKRKENKININLYQAFI